LADEDENRSGFHHFLYELRESARDILSRHSPAQNQSIFSTTSRAGIHQIHTHPSKQAGGRSENEFDRSARVKWRIARLIAAREIGIQIDGGRCSARSRQ
jgi:hypothetical protein